MVGKTFFETPTAELQAALPLQQYHFDRPVGNIFYVGSTVSGAEDSASRGCSPATPLATLDYAIGLCTANNGDHIVVLPGHAETYSTTGTKITFDVAGVTIVGLGKGSERPTFTFSNTGATWSWTAAGVTLKNVLLVTGVDLVTTFGTISGADATLEGIETRDTTDIEVIDAFICTGARLTVRNHFHNGYTGGDANVRVFKLTGVAAALFEGCRFLTKVTTAVINFVTGACSKVVVRNCVFLVTSTTNFSKTVVDTITGSTWAVDGSNFDLGAGSNFSGGSGAALAAASGGSATSSGVSSVGTLVSTGNSSTVSLGVADSTGHSKSLSSNVSLATSIATPLSSILSKVLTL